MIAVHCNSRIVGRFSLRAFLLWQVDAPNLARCPSQISNAPSQVAQVVLGYTSTGTMLRILLVLHHETTNNYLTLFSHLIPRPREQEGRQLQLLNVPWEIRGHQSRSQEVPTVTETCTLSKVYVAKRPGGFQGPPRWLSGVTATPFESL